MDFITAILLIVIIGFVVWLLTTYFKMHPAFSATVWFLAILAVLFNLFGISTGFWVPSLP